MTDKQTINDENALANTQPDCDELARERNQLLLHTRALEREIEGRDKTDGIWEQLNAASSQTIFSPRRGRWVSRYGRVKARVARVARQGLRRSSQNGFGNGDHEVDYRSWVKRHDVLTVKDRASIAKRIAELKYRPRISIFVLPSAQAGAFLGRTIDSLRAQLYPDFDVLIISHDASTQPLPESADERFRILTPEDGEAAVSVVNRTLQASGEFVGFVTAGDELAAHALYLFVEQLHRFAGAHIIYSDEDSIDADGARSNPYFKPDWNQDLLHSGDFLSRLALYRTALLQSIGGLRADFGENAFYDLGLRSTEGLSRLRIRHLPHVLYHRRAAPHSSNGDGSQVRALQEHFDRQSIGARVTSSRSGSCRVQYPLNRAQPLVSVIIATRDRVDLLRQIVSDVLNKTDYAPLELIVVDNQSRDPATREYLQEIQEHPATSVLTHDGYFNFSAINNLAARSARGEVLAFLNNDLKIISGDWLREMVSHAMRAGIGAVGAKLYYPDGTIQHAGIILGLGKLAGYAHRYAPRDAAGHGGRLNRVQDCSAVTAACMVLKRAAFEDVGGFDDENLPVAYNDVDLCLRLRERGYRILWTPHAELYHFESASRPSDLSREERKRYERECAYLKARWHHEVARDPFYNPNLTTAAEDYSLAWPPRVGKPWKG